MSLDVRVGFDGEKLAALLEDRRVDLREATVEATRDSALEILGEIRRSLRRSSIIGLGDNQASAWRQHDEGPTKDGTGWAVNLGATHPMALARDRGAKVLPGKTAARGGPRRGQKTRALAIPTAKAKTKIARVARAGRVGTAGGTANFGELSAVLWRPKGRRIFGALYPKGGDPKRDALFLLARSVTIPPRPYIQPSVDKAQPKIREHFTRRLLEALS